MRCNIVCFFIIVFSLVFVFSCKEPQASENKVYPDISIIDVEYYMSDKNGNKVRFNADKMDLYNKENRTVLEGAEFVQFNAETGEEVIKGKAQKADINFKSYVCSLSGDVEIDIIDSGNKIYAADINWDKNNESIITEGEIVVDYGDVLIEGVGFSGNLKDREYKVQKITDGVIRSKERNFGNVDTSLTENNNNTVEKTEEGS